MKRSGLNVNLPTASVPSRGGAVLLEVVLALTLFVAAATVITGGLNASVREVERLRLNVHASNLAFSVLSELHLGLRSLESGGPEPFTAPFDQWTWQIQCTPLAGSLIEGNPLQQVEIIVRHQHQPVVQRLCQLMPAIPLVRAATSDSSASRTEAPAADVSAYGLALSHE